MDDFLQYMDNKMNALLDNQLKQCYCHSSIVMIKYKELITIFKTGDVNDVSFYLETIDELKECALQEYDAYDKLLIYDKARLIPRLDSLLECNANDVEVLRLQNKLRSTKNIFDGFNFKASELLIDDIPNDIRFDINSAILAAIYIKTFKNIKSKLDLVVCESKQDLEFCDLLYKELYFKILYKMCENDLFEAIGMFNNIEIDKFPDINTNILKKCLSKKYSDDDIDKHINEKLLNLLINDINLIKNIKCLKNDSESVFQYLYFVISLEVIMLYMNKEYLLKLYEYYNNTDFENKYICNDICNKIKRRIKVEN